MTTWLYTLGEGWVRLDHSERHLLEACPVLSPSQEEGAAKTKAKAPWWRQLGSGCLSTSARAPEPGEKCGPGK